MVFLKNSHYLIRKYGFLSDKVGFSGKKNTLSANKVGFSLINPVYLRKPIVSASADKVGLFGKQSLSACADNLTLSVSADNMGSLS